MKSSFGVFKKRIGRLLISVLMICSLGVCGCGEKPQPAANGDAANGDVPFGEAREEILQPDLMTEYDEDLQRFKSSDYRAVFLSMFEPVNYSEAYFEDYRGLKTFIPEYTLSQKEALEYYCRSLKECVDSGQEIEHCYIGIDPYLLYQQLDAGEDKGFDAYIEALMNQTGLEENVSFIFPAYSIGYYSNMDDTALNNLKWSYDRFAACVNDRIPGASIYFYGGCEWLICNRFNYLPGDYQSLQPDIAKKLFLYTICDGKYAVDSENIDGVMTEICELAKAYSEEAVTYPDLSEKRIVILGDSIFGNYSDSTSIQQIMANFSGAKVDSVAIGGASAALTDGKILGGQPELLDGVFSEASEDEAVTFILEFGLNDYLWGRRVDDPEDKYNIDSFGGALRVAIEDIKEKHPEAEFILVIPGCITLNNNGMDVMGDGGASLSQYRTMIETIANEYGGVLFDFSADVGISQEECSKYLDDGIHYNGEGRYKIALALMEFISKQIQ